MRIRSEKSFLFKEDSEEVTIKSGEIKDLPDWVKKTELYKLAKKDGSVLEINTKKDKQKAENDEKIDKQKAENDEKIDNQKADNDENVEDPKEPPADK